MFANGAGEALGECIERAWDDGAAHTGSVLRRSSLAKFASHLHSRLELRAAERRVGSVEQVADLAVIAGPELRDSFIGPLAAEFGALARQHAGRLVSAGFAPNEATVMRYRGTGSGIGPHRDRRRYRELVAILSLVGVARLDLVADRAGRRVIQSWECRAGDLVILRAPGLGGLDDGRPLHRVLGPPNGARTSLSLRMDANDPGLAPSWSR